MLASRSTVVVLGLAAATLTAAQLLRRPPARPMSTEPPASDEMSPAERVAICEALADAEPPRPSWQRATSQDPIMGAEWSVVCGQSGLATADTGRVATDGAPLACDPWARPCTTVTPEAPDHPSRDTLVLRGILDRADRNLRRIEKRAFE